MNSSLELHVPEVLLIDRVLPFINSRSDLSSLSLVSRSLRRILLSSLCGDLWDKSSANSFLVCIDGYCPNCKFKHAGTFDSAIRFLSSFPAKRIKIHCFLNDIPYCLAAVSSVGLLQHLALSLTAKSHGLPLEEILSNAFDCSFGDSDVAIEDVTPVVSSNIEESRNTKLNTTTVAQNVNQQLIEYDIHRSTVKFIGRIPCELNCDSKGRISLGGLKHLKQLTLNSAHLNHVRIQGRSKLLDFLGGNLEFLSFRHLSPSGVFSIISQRCPKLRYLRVDRAQTMPDLHNFVHKLVEELELRRCNFVLSDNLQLPALRRLRYSACFRMELKQVRTLVSFIPRTIVDLSVEIPSSLANQFMVLVSKSLPLLQQLALEGAHETDTISARALLYMGRKCRQMRSIQIRHAKSVHALSFGSKECMTVLRSQFPSLQMIRMRYEEALVPGLKLLLSESSLQQQEPINSSNAMQEVVLWERKRWMELDRWNNMEATVRQLSMEYPATKVTLENV